MYRWLQAIWYGQRRIPVALRVLALLFAALTRARRYAYSRGWLAAQRVACPLIVIGNISVGGTGKTPLTIWLARQLQLGGLKVGVVLRGYGGTAVTPLQVDAHSAAAVVGDEALLIHQRSGCLVAVGRDRVAAARLLAGLGAQIIIADDGLQHLRLHRDLEIAVIDGERGFGNGLLLPAGPLREPVSRLDGVGLVVQNGGVHCRYPGSLRMKLEGDTLLPLSGSGAALPLARLGGKTVHAVAAIGNPARFFLQLAASGLRVIEHALPDHQVLQRSDLSFGDSLPVLMTEKDAVKCRDHGGSNHWYLPVNAVFEADDARRLLESVHGLTLARYPGVPVVQGPAAL